MKVAFIRGPSLNPWDLESVKPLFSKHSFTLFATTRTPYWKEIPLTDTVLERCFWPDSWVASLSPKAADLFNGACSRLFGVSFHMAGLTNRLRGFDILHAQETYSTYTYQALQAKQRWGGKLVVTVWETIPHRGESHPLRTQRKNAVLAQADAFLAVTERSREMLLKEGVSAGRIHVLSPGIDTDHFSPQESSPAQRAAFGAAAEDFVLLCVARLVRWKGVYDLLEALSILSKEKGCRLRLVFVGRGPEREGMQAWLAKAALTDRVHFAGGLSYDQMPAAYAAADATALPSVPTAIWEEQFGYALVEAMSMAKPVITTSSGAIPHVVGDAARLVPPSSPQKLAEAIQELMRNPGTARDLGMKGRVRALAHYQSQGTATALENLYNRLP